MKVWSAVAFFQNFFVGCFKEAITDVVSKIECSQNSTTRIQNSPLGNWCKNPDGKSEFAQKRNHTCKGTWANIWRSFRLQNSIHALVEWTYAVPPAWYYRWRVWLQFAFQIRLQCLAPLRTLRVDPMVLHGNFKAFRCTFMKCVIKCLCVK